MDVTIEIEKKISKPTVYKVMHYPDDLTPDNIDKINNYIIKQKKTNKR